MTIVRRLAFSIFLSLASWCVQAQPGNPEGDPDAVPITGLEYLLVGGGIYGASRLMRRNKDKSADQ
ncbi:MAG TPA: hypothetical protein VK658_04750 [Chryseolinea sp.]|nr:hypothetical protein [Chryseolinea sp.]